MVQTMPRHRPHRDMTEALFRDDAYLAACTARVTAVDERGVQLDRSVFYPLGGGQLGDTGQLQRADGPELAVTHTVRDRGTGEHLHVVADAAGLSVGDEVEAVLDWPRRYRIMRWHGALHLLCASVDAPVTSGSIQVDRARLDFDLDAAPDKAALEEALNELVRRDVAISSRHITDAELDANPGLVRTMSVQPPRNASGTIRLVEFAGVDLQPCGGTHVRSTAEIGALRVTKIEKKGRQNRRIVLGFDE